MGLYWGHTWVYHVIAIVMGFVMGLYIYNYRISHRLISYNYIWLPS